ncbi:MAG: sigma-70 family RNA polymerase sigma factor [Archangiaceae bacterium]|nr:sigma-70 family RNA polymerase sigma factor [Archangiaceae bacterium]
MPEFRTVYREEAPYVFRVLRRLGVRDSELEDLAHDVFVAAYRAWARLDPAQPVRPWLFGIAYRLMLDHHRKRSTHSEVPSARVPETVDDRGGPAEHAARRQGLSLAARIIEGLELDRRAVFVLHELEELPMPQIAEALEVPLNTAYSRLRLARRDFAAAAAQATGVTDGRA